MRLYNFWRSSSSWRVRIALNWKSLAFEYVPVGLTSGEQFGEAHRARSPMSKVPALEIEPGTILVESMAILEWLEETHPDPPLLPRTPVARARARAAAEMVNSGIQPFQNLSVLKRLKALGVDEQAWAADAIAAGLAGLERAAAETAGQFFVGDAPSFADVLLIPQLRHGRRYHVDLSALPTLLRIEQACAALPAFAAAEPERQPDAPREA